MDNKILEIFNMSNQDYENISKNGRNLIVKNYSLDKFSQQIINGGWHFSFLQTPSQILNKIKSFSHGEFNQEGLNTKIIEKKILENEDIFGRENKLKRIDVDNSYPTYITKNKDKLSDWII